MGQVSLCEDIEERQHEGVQQILDENRTFLGKKANLEKDRSALPSESQVFQTELRRARQDLDEARHENQQLRIRNVSLESELKRARTRNTSLYRLVCWFVGKNI
jgi:hypothetical protein